MVIYIPNTINNMKVILIMNKYVLNNIDGIFGVDCLPSECLKFISSKKYGNNIVK